MAWTRFLTPSTKNVRRASRCARSAWRRLIASSVDPASGPGATFPKAPLRCGAATGISIDGQRRRCVDARPRGRRSSRPTTRSRPSGRVPVRPCLPMAPSRAGEPTAPSRHKAASYGFPLLVQHDHGHQRLRYRPRIAPRPARCRRIRGWDWSNRRAFVGRAFQAGALPLARNVGQGSLTYINASAVSRRLGHTHLPLCARGFARRARKWHHVDRITSVRGRDF
jgi:hypothetical protein